MKKTFIFSLIASFILAFGFVSCDKNKKQDSANTDVKNDTTLVAENVISTAKQYMYNNYGGDYRWFETSFVLKNFLDEENDGTLDEITNVFQVVNETKTGADVHVVMISQVKDSTDVKIIDSFWLEDSPLNDEKIKLTFKDAFDKLMQANCPKPHSRQVVLRKQVGPLDCNPQYIFGNIQAQVYVDAVTGNVTEHNPAFPEELKMPLGEWP